MDADTWIEKLIERENNYATFQTINRSASYSPTLVREDGENFEFECQGSSVEPYQISIWKSSTGKIESDCTCPFEGQGICKHQVAAIHRLKQLIKKEEVSLLGDVSVKPQHTQKRDTTTRIKCDVGVLNKQALNNIEFNQESYYYADATVNPINRTKITGVYDDYRDKFNLSFTYDAKQDVAVLACSCGIKKPCSHKFKFLKKIINLFGLNYFSPTFESDVKNEILAREGLLGKIEFDEVFDLIISEEGVDYDEKVLNVKSVDDSPLRLFGANRQAFYLPPSSKDEEEIGIGLCFEFNKKELYSVYPFSGKYNPKKQQITSKLGIINEYNFDQILRKIKRDKEKQFLFQATQLAKVYANTPETAHVDDMNLLWETTNKVLPFLPNMPIYRYNNRHSFVKKNVVELTYDAAFIEPVVKIIEQEKFYKLEFKVRIQDKLYGLKSKDVFVTAVGIVIEDTFYSYKSSEEAMYMDYAIRNAQLNIIKTGLETLKKNVIQPLSAVFEIDFKAVKPAKTMLTSFEKHVYLSDVEGEYIVFQPLVKYGELSVSPCSKEKVWADEEGLDYITRNDQEEKEFLSWMQSLHPTFKNRTEYFYIAPEEALNDMWLMETIDKLKNEGVTVFGMNTLKNIRYNLNKPTFQTSVSSGTDWFDLKIDIQFGDQKVDLKSLQKAILNKTNYVELKDGTLGILPEKWIEKYKKYFQLGQLKKDAIEISNFQFNIIDELYEELTNAPQFLEELYEKKKRLSNLSELKPVPKPRNLKATLRPYQQEGLNWMVFLHENKLGGCLADDMGLGKTLQTIAFLQHLKNNTPTKDKIPHLVIAPTSLMFNWQAEIEKFAPKLNTLVYIGANRSELQDEIPKSDIVLTTYGSVVNDIHFHQKQHYDYVILDESQAIKNPQSQRFKAVRLLKCNNRLALTGTPIENNTFDLYSQFNFINPGIFGSVKHFRSNFSDAIDKEQDQEVSQLLARMINPFILRRTKTQVATELPSKTEAVIYCEMGEEQRNVYNEFKKHFRQKLMEQIEQEGVNKSQMYILQGLTKLRQICNSTALADQERDYGNFSVKLDELVRHLKEKVNNHKVLVFSQFVGMLQLVKARLVEEGITFEYLDGQTRNREEKVTNFQTNDEIRVFLISLKAGGTGLNLTEADYVYLIDPWWNPAVENQAIDRCYRIGQDKKVMAYRMICKDTIEEKIVQLQDKKKTVAAEVIQVDTEKKTFNKVDVERFFG